MKNLKVLENRLEELLLEKEKYLKEYRKRCGKKILFLNLDIIDRLNELDTHINNTRININQIKMKNF